MSNGRVSSPKREHYVPPHNSFPTPKATTAILFSAILQATPSTAATYKSFCGPIMLPALTRRRSQLPIFRASVHGEARLARIHGPNLGSNSASLPRRVVHPPFSHSHIRHPPIPPRPHIHMQRFRPRKHAIRIPALLLRDPRSANAFAQKQGPA